MFTLILNLLFPRQCCNCVRVGNYLCRDCYELVQFFPLPIELDLEPCYLDELWSAVRFEPSVPQLIHSLKYQAIKGIGPWLGELLYQTMQIPECDMVTAVPLHGRRQQQRGFNQAELIAAALAAKMSKPYKPLLTRPHYTTSQASLSHRSDRLTHLQNAFKLNPTFAQSLTNQRILIIDDVTTTGTTLNECAAVLKAAGAKSVVGLTVSHGG